MLFVFQIIGDLGSLSRFTCTLQTDHHEDARILLGVVQTRFLTKQNKQFVVDDLDQLLARLDRGQDFLTESLVPDLV